MKELKKDFTKKGGCKYHQLFKNDRFAIYECTQTFEEGEPIVFYEIFKMVVKKPDMFHDDEYEAYPSDEEFGVRAWCCSDFGSVVRVFENDIKEDISEYAKFFKAFGVESLQKEKPYNYEGTEKIDDCITQGWMLYN